MISTLNKIYYFAALLVIAGILLKVSNNDLATPIVITGSIAYAIARILMALNMPDRKKSRIPLIQFVSAISLLGAAYFMYVNSNSWPVFILITAVLEVYASFRMDGKK